jgi:hypothetical protein
MVRQLMLLIFLLSLLSCKRNECFDFSINGNWYYFENDTIYHERYFTDSTYIDYSSFLGFSENYYRIKYDSLIIYDHNNLKNEYHPSSTEVRVIDSNKIEFIYTNESYLLNRFSDSLITLKDLVKDFNDTSYFYYQLQYYKRGNQLLNNIPFADTMEYVFNLNNDNWDMVKQYFKNKE